MVAQAHRASTTVRGGSSHEDMGKVTRNGQSCRIHSTIWEDCENGIGHRGRCTGPEKDFVLREKDRNYVRPDIATTHLENRCARLDVLRS